MKELSIEEKAKRYDEAIERAKEVNREHFKNGFKPSDDVLYIFPELKENKDERIRKELLNYLYDVHDDDEERARWIAWLEKQGEQKFEQKFFINDKVVHKATGKIWTIHHYLKDTNSYYVEDNDGLLHHYRESELKLVEQELAEWSKEDNDKIYQILAIIDDYRRFYTIKPSLRKALLKDLGNIEAWLKSLRPQNHWKPSLSQLNALSIVSKGNAPDDIEEINSLYNNLKKLKEE